MAIAEELQVVIRAEAEKAIHDMERFGSTVNKAEGGLEQFGKGATSLGGSMTRMITGPLLALGGAFFAATIEAGNYADKILDLNQVTGLSTDYLQELEGVARVAGVSFEGLTGTIQRFSARLPSIESGSSEAAEAFNRLGVELRDGSGQIRSMELLFPELIASLQDIENITERNALAQQIFGRSLGDLAPVLGMTADEMERARQESEKFLRTEEELERANEYRIAIAELGAEVKDLWRDLAQDLMPVIRDSVLPAFSQAIEVVKDVVRWFGDLDQKTQQLIISAGIASAALGLAVGLAGKAASAAVAVKSLAIAFGLTNPIVAAFLVTLSAIVAGVGYLISRARTAAEENKLLADAIQGSVRSLEEYDEALAVLDREEQSRTENISRFADQLRVLDEEIAQHQGLVQEAQAAGDRFWEDAVRRELDAREAQREELRQLIAVEQELADTRRSAVEANRTGLEQQLLAEQRAAEEQRMLELEAQAARIQARIEIQAAAAAQEEVTDETSDTVAETVRLEKTFPKVTKKVYEARDAVEQFADNIGDAIGNMALLLGEVEAVVETMSYLEAESIRVGIDPDAFTESWRAALEQANEVIPDKVTFGIDNADWISLGADIAGQIAQALKEGDSINQIIGDVIINTIRVALNMWLPGVGEIFKGAIDAWAWIVETFNSDIREAREADEQAERDRQARVDALNELLDAEMQIRNDALRQLDRTFQLEFRVLEDLWDRNIIGTEEFVDRMDEMSDAYETERDDIESEVRRIRELMEESAIDRIRRAMEERGKVPFWISGDDEASPATFSSGRGFVGSTSASGGGTTVVNINGPVYGIDDLGVKTHEALELAKHRGLIPA